MIEELSRPLKASERRVMLSRAKSVRSHLDAGFYDKHFSGHYDRFTKRLTDEAQTGAAYVIHCAPTRIITRPWTRS